MEQQYITYFCIFGIITILLIYFLKNSNSKQEQPILIESNFLISMKILDITIDDYCNFQLIPKIEKLKKSYDLDEDSQTNAFDQFNTEYMDTINKSTKYIVNELLSETVRNELLVYFSIDSLLLYIIGQCQIKIKGV